MSPTTRNAPDFSKALSGDCKNKDMDYQQSRYAWFMETNTQRPEMNNMLSAWHQLSLLTVLRSHMEEHNQ